MADYRYYYNYAIVNKSMGYLCLEIRTTTADFDGHENDTELYVRIPVYNDGYLMKYYDRDNDKWYYDSSFTNEWTPPTE